MDEIEERSQDNFCQDSLSKSKALLWEYCISVGLQIRSFETIMLPVGWYDNVLFHRGGRVRSRYIYKITPQSMTEYFHNSNGNGSLPQE